MSQVSRIAVEESDLRVIVDTVMESFLHEHAVIAPPAQVTEVPGDEVWVGCVTMNGAFTGAVTLTCTRGFARRAARSLFSEEPSFAAEDEAARDVLAELTNVMGGNIKCLLATLGESTSNLSLPLVSVGSLEIPGAALSAELWSECGSDRIRVAIFEALPPTNTTRQ